MDKNCDGGVFELGGVLELVNFYSWGQEEEFRGKDYNGQFAIDSTSQISQLPHSSDISDITAVWQLISLI